MKTLSVFEAFSHVASHMPFYKKILSDKNIDPALIVTMDDFITKVPILHKQDIFSKFSPEDLVQNGDMSEIRSAILTSGTSGVFAYSLLTKKDEQIQQGMVDDMLKTFFNAEQEPPLIINALAMGVTFASSYPVITTSVRSDMVIHVLKTLSPHYKRTIIVADPYFAKKIIDEACESGFDWTRFPIVFVVGGSLSSNSLLQYMLYRINKEQGIESNIVQGTMGLTEIGLNIFSALPDLISIRNNIQHDKVLMNKLFGDSVTVCPELMYYNSERVFVEIINPDAHGFGEIVLSNLDMTALNPLIRYNTGDVGKFLDKKDIPEAQFPLPIIAIGGRSGDRKDGISLTAIILEALFCDVLIAKHVSGHFKVQQTEQGLEVIVHIRNNDCDKNHISAEITKNLNILGVNNIHVLCEASLVFDQDVDISYEGKWKHTLKK